MTRFVTLNQFVNLWECDENDHMNVQFYFSKFDDAGRIFALCHGLERMLGKPNRRHVRYHSELRGGAQITIRSSIAQMPENAEDFFGLERAHGTIIQHVMEESSNGRLAATALDFYPSAVAPQSEDIVDTVLDAALPRGLSLPPDMGIRSAPSNTKSIISRVVLHPALCDANGMALDQAYIGAVSDAAAHGWDRLGINSDWLDERAFGRVAVEMRLCVHHPMRSGTVYQVQHSITGKQNRSYNKRLDFFDLRTGQHFAFVDATVMLLNHKTRRSEPLPEFAVQAIDHIMKAEKF